MSTLVTLLSATALAGDCTGRDDDPCDEIVLPGRVPASTVSVELDGQAVVDNPEPTFEYMHGFRLGYNFINVDPSTHDQLRSNHLFVIGYEFTQRMYGGDWLNVIAVQNVMVSGIEQSLFLPSANLLIGFEADERVQLGVGPNVNPLAEDGKYLHMVAAVGFTPDVGVFNVPIHVAYIPDVDGHWRLATTTGVNW